MPVKCFQILYVYKIGNTYHTASCGVMVHSLTTLAAKALAQAGEGPYVLGKQLYDELDYARFCETTPVGVRTAKAARLGKSLWIRKLHKEGVPWHHIPRLRLLVMGIQNVSEYL